MREGRGHRGRHMQREHVENGHFHQRSAQTFRRGRAVAFLDTLNVRKSTLQRQLSDPDYAEIRAVISGELKATDAIIDEFIQVFQLHDQCSDEQGK